jgi:hypothetical protein
MEYSHLTIRATRMAFTPLRSVKATGALRVTFTHNQFEEFMIFQSSVMLDVEGREVHVVFDLETGLMGFTEIVDGARKQYDYLSSPQSFKIGLIKLMEEISGENRQLNTLISGKSEVANLLHGFWSKEGRTQR